MHCPSCNKTLEAGKKCPKCGKMAVASSSDEIDLMPLDEPKAAPAGAFHPPPEAFLPPPLMPGKGVKRVGPVEPGQEAPAEEPMRARAGAMVSRGPNTTLIAGGIIAVLIVGFICWRIFRTENKIVLGNGNLPSKNFAVQPNNTLVQNLEISGQIKWKLDVTAIDDPVSIGVVQRNPKDPQTLAALKQLPDPYEVVKKGETKSMSGEFKTGKYSWVVLNENKKSVRVKVTFKAQP